MYVSLLILPNQIMSPLYIVLRSFDIITFDKRADIYQKVVCNKNELSSDYVFLRIRLNGILRCMT